MNTAGKVTLISLGILTLAGIAFIIVKQSKASNATTEPETKAKTVASKVDAITQLKSVNPNIGAGVSSYDEAFLIAWANATLASVQTFTYLNKKYNTLDGTVSK